jgi:hypothetical protein
MTTQREQAHLSMADDAASGVPIAATRGWRSSDVTIAEWTVDLEVIPVGPQAPTAASLAGAGYVDFDALESLHPTRSGAASRR